MIPKLMSLAFDCSSVRPSIQADMFQVSLSFLTLLGLVAVGRGSSIPQIHELKRAACNSDNVLRALQHAGASASSFCSSYIGIPVKTVYTDVPGVTPVM